MRNLRPKKSFGQHFLADKNTARVIAEAATPTPGGTVLEIGPGKGVLTDYLLQRAARVVAIERDRELIPYLCEAYFQEITEGKLVLLEDDAASADWSAALVRGPRPRTIVGNIPYNITGCLLEIATRQAHEVEVVVFMVQREVADRMVALPDSEPYGALSVFLQAAFSIERVRLVRPGAFVPPPRVESVVVRMTPLRPPRAEETPAFRELVRRAFAARRKTLRNAWKSIFGYSSDKLCACALAAGVSLDVRGETLSVEDFDRMAQECTVLGSITTESSPWEAYGERKAHFLRASTPRKRGPQARPSEVASKKI
ncbi:MAG: 16S rRNA (adenine(1518)-N(6)/adenine(1519)-N(6))-dimethyltransferase RsmA [Myxococcales bacterium]|nr:16S rRNA (adenine(1518)-N(6)/adenine(1519)-N(6))-dimethyltransferase RsmA [Polyangiaceae bacterium]MDW8247673.1 16S rRNA (adenine(1518)-N(6)/adenine(1519)-N(6))-dimethyltransferase RsmA [Myxococcales bacterium]